MSAESLGQTAVACTLSLGTTTVGPFSLNPAAHVLCGYGDEFLYYIFDKMVDTHRAQDKGNKTSQWLTGSDWPTVVLGLVLLVSCSVTLNHILECMVKATLAATACMVLL